MRKVSQVFAIALCTLRLASAACGDEPPDVVETKVTHVALFKNGYGFFTREGSLPEGEERVFLDRVPRASLGTLWFGTSGTGARVVDAKVVRRVALLERPAMNFEELIRSNPGVHARITVVNKEVIGKLLPVPEEFEYPDSGPFFPPSPERTAYRGRGGFEPVPGHVRPEIFMVRTTDDEVVAVRFSEVRQVNLRGESRTVFEE
ncbi:MAG: hypothetical protein KAJ01_04395, partial [Candidatus Hydrogenedentes bacterium]|nr:hypothetical protein [Candidatus Hydrogenedentota bacterium]